MATLPRLHGLTPLNADDTTYHAFTADTDLDVATYGFDNTPTDFGSMNTDLTFTGTALLNAAPPGSGPDTYAWSVAIINGTTVLAGASSTYNGTTYAHCQSIATVTNNTDQTDGPTTFSYVSTTATKSDWDNATIQIVQGYTKDKGGDVNFINADHVYFDGTYNLAAITRTAVVSGSGTVSSVTTHPRTAAVSASGTVNTSITHGRIATVTANGTVTATKLTVTTRAAVVSATGSVTAVKTRGALATVDATGSVTAAWTKTAKGLAVVTANGTAAASYYKIHFDHPAIVTANGTVSAAVTFPRTAAVTANGTVTAAVTHVRIATVSASGSVTATPTIYRTRTALVAANGTLTGTYTTVTTYTAVVTGSSSVTAYKTEGKTATVTATGSVTASTTAAVTRTAVVSASGSVTATATVTIPRTAVVAATGSVTATATATNPRTAAVSATGSVTATATVVRLRTALVTANGSVTTTSTATNPRTALVSANGTVAATTTITRPRTALVTANGTVVANTTGAVGRTAAVTATGTVTATATITRARTANIAATGTVTGAYSKTLLRTALVKGRSSKYYADFNGVSGDYVSTPDSATNSVTGDIDIRVKVAMDDWTPAAEVVLVSKWSNSGLPARSYALTVHFGGTLRFYVSPDGSINNNFTPSSVATGFTNGTLHWVRTTWSDSLDQVNFYTSDDGVNWSQLGTADLSLVSAGIYDSNTQVELGAHTNGTVGRVTADIYEAYVYDGIDGSLAVDFNASDNPTSAATHQDSFGATWSWTDINSVRDITATYSVIEPKTASISANGNITAVYSVIKPRTAVVSATGTVTAIVVANVQQRSAIVSATGSMTAAYADFYSRTATISATGAVTASFTQVFVPLYYDISCEISLNARIEAGITQEHNVELII